jgi:putative transposase
VACGRRTFLFAFLDDHSRAVVGHRFGFSEDTVRLAAALRPALAARGIPQAVYVDNGSAFVDTWLKRACASLGIRLIHSTPRRPQGRGKVERFFRTVREQFLVETGPLLEPIDDPRQALHALNQHFDAWVATIYHPRVHSETGQPPIKRWLAGAPPAFPRADTLREAFKWSEFRTVTKTATVSLHGNIYQVEPALAGRKIELVFDPFDLNLIDVRHNGQPAGAAIPHQIKRHAHPKARPELPIEPAPATGVDYLHLIRTSHDQQLAAGINYTALTGPDSSDEAAAVTPAKENTP